MKRLILPCLALMFLSGCSAAQYYEQQPNRDAQEALRVQNLAAGYKGIAEAVFGKQHQEPQQNSGKVCESCGGPFQYSGPTSPVQILPGNKVQAPPIVGFNPFPQPVAPVAKQKEPKVEATVYLEDKDGTVSPAQIDFIAEEGPEQVPQPNGGRTGSAGQNTFNYNYGLPMPAAQGNGMTAGGIQADLLLQYIMWEKTADAQQSAAKEKTKQVQAIVSAYTQAVLKPQPEQKAPFDPTDMTVEAIKQMPLISSIIGGVITAGKAIEGAAGSTTATLSNGSSLSQDGATSGGGYTAPVTTTNTTHASAE